jgi:hypothetical protein
MKINYSPIGDCIRPVDERNQIHKPQRCWA